jgi:protein-disulfide isomerase
MEPTQPTDQNLSKKERQELKRDEKIDKQLQAKNKKRLTTIILWSFIVLFVGGTIAAMIALTAKNPGVQYVEGTVKAPDDTDWTKGAPLKDAKVVLTEYGDFQCPACGAYYPIVKKIGSDFKNLTIVFRNFPLAQHNNARAAAQAAGAAGEQGKFWEMHDILYENQNFWAESPSAEAIFITYAQKLGLDLEKYKIDFNSAKIKTKITADYQGGANSIDGTPTFFLNNKKIENPQTYEQFKSVIQQAGGTL